MATITIVIRKILPKYGCKTDVEVKHSKLLDRLYVDFAVANHHNLL